MHFLSFVLCCVIYKTGKYIATTAMVVAAAAAVPALPEQKSIRPFVFAIT